MPQTRECDYCGSDIEPGTGTMFVRTDGSTVHYCSAKCEKNDDLGREPRDVEWTETAREDGERREAAAAAREQVTEPEAEDEPEADVEETDAEDPDEAEDAGESDAASEEEADDGDAEVEEADGESESDEADAESAGDEADDEETEE